MNKKLKLSQWHDGSVKPVHVGVYERDYSDNTDRVSIMLCKWDGFGFSWAHETVSLCALDFSGIYSASQNLPWRGIVK